MDLYMITAVWSMSLAGTEVPVLSKPPPIAPNYRVASLA